MARHYTSVAVSLGTSWLSLSTLKRLDARTPLHDVEPPILGQGIEQPGITLPEDATYIPHADQAVTVRVKRVECLPDQLLHRAVPRIGAGGHNSVNPSMPL